MVVAGALTACWLTIGPQLTTFPRLLLLLGALGAHVAVVTALHRHESDPRVVLAIGTALLVLAVAFPPQGSKDLWAYAMQGRIVAVHHANPWVHAPTQYPDDPALQRVAHGWRGSTNPYGPVFTMLETVGAWAAGGSALVTRLYFQGLAALGVLAVALALRRRPGGAAAAAFLILNPAVVATVNGGHNDVLVGAAIFAAVALADRRRLAAAGILIAAAALVKVTALVAIPAVLVWLVRRGQCRQATRFVASSALPFLVGYAVFGGLGALDGLQKSAGWMSRAALFRWPRELLFRRLMEHGWSKSAATGWAGHAMTLATLCCVLGALLLVWRLGTTGKSSGAAVVPTLVALVFSMAYVLPWYALWVLPSAAARVGSRSTAAAWTLAAALLVAYTNPPGFSSSAALPSFLSHTALPVGAAVVLVLVVKSVRQQTGSARS